MSMEDSRRLLQLLSYKPISLDRDADYRSKFFTLGYLKVSNSRLKDFDFSGSVFYKCAFFQDEIPQLNTITCVDCTFYKDSESFLSEVEDLKRKADFVNFDFTYLTSLEGLNFQGEDLSGADFSNMTLDSVSFEDCKLISANFRNALLVNCNFRDADLSDADIMGVDADLSQFETADTFPNDLHFCEGCEGLMLSSYMHDESFCYNCNTAWEDSRTCDRCGEIDPDGLSPDDLCSSCDEDEEEDEEED